MTWRGECGSPVLTSASRSASCRSRSAYMAASDDSGWPDFSSAGLGAGGGLARAPRPGAAPPFLVGLGVVCLGGPRGGGPVHCLAPTGVRRRGAVVAVAVRGRRPVRRPRPRPRPHPRPRPRPGPRDCSVCHTLAGEVVHVVVVGGCPQARYRVVRGAHHRGVVDDARACCSLLPRPSPQPRTTRGRRPRRSSSMWAFYRTACAPDWRILKPIVCPRRPAAPQPRAAQPRLRGVVPLARHLSGQTPEPHARLGRGAAADGGGG